MLLLPRQHRFVVFLAVFCLWSCFWMEIRTLVTGQKPPATSASLTTFSSDRPSPIGPAPDSFFLSTLRRSCSPVVIPTDDYLGPQWGEIAKNMTQHFERRDYSCKHRCGESVEERKSPLLRFRCFCDKFCEDFGDCCFDFDALCRTHVNPETSNETCLADKSGVHGHTVWNTCPQNWTERSVRQKCQEEDQSDILRNLPVFDKDSYVHYKSIFCAKCNGAVNTSYWRLQFICFKSANVTTFKLGNDVILLPPNCSVEKFPLPYRLLHQLKQCIPRFLDCQNVSPEKNGSYCQTECLRYAFPVCSDKGKVRFRNPQCALCNGFTPNDLDSRCDSDSPGKIIGSLSILFDFSSTSKYTVRVIDRNGNEKTTEKDFSCRLDEVYDTLTGSCKKSVVSIESKNASNGERSTNCTVIAFNKTNYVQLSNGSVYLKPHNKIYKNTTYIIRDSRLLLCVNFSRTEKAGFSEYQISKTLPSLQLLSLIGCIVSMVSLVLLLITYILFAELRINLPGKIIINLALSLLLYQSVFLSAAKTDDQDTCLAVAVLLHFFALSSFTWMNVMAYDVHRTFTTSGGVANRKNRQQSYTGRLVKYCLYAWGSPVLLVLVCVIADHAKKGSIGYGKGEEECFISQPQALLYSFVLPVALLMIFNMFALGHTLIHIVKTRKRTQKATNQRHGTSVGLICVKMASVMGVTWILGIAANLKTLSFLWYPYVVLNSLQGLFIFLSFAASGKALVLYKSKLAGILKKPSSKSTADNRRNRSYSEQFISQADEDQDTLDVRV